MIDKKKVPVILLLTILAMFLLSAPVEFWIRLISPNFVPDIIFYVLWIGCPLMLPLSHLINNTKMKIICHLIVEAWMVPALCFWGASFLSGLVFLSSAFIPGITAEDTLKIAITVYILISFGSVLIGVLNALAVRKRHRSIELGLDKPMKIALFSDLHLGFFTTRGMLSRVSGIVANEKPDVILFAGDFFDMDYSSLRKKEECKKILSGMNAVSGKYACLGNHDFYLDDPRKEEMIQKTGFRILRDEKVQIGDLCLLGRRDRMDPEREEIDSLLKKGKRKNPTLVLDHNPSAYAEYADRADLLFCGHTHGGQTFPGNLIQKLFMNYPVYGYREYGNLKTFVTSGAGFWGFPFRIGVCNEVVILEIK